ncbi:PREDICTED: cell wall integrity and stress response component 4-like [Polistes dominula]|uniref:Cell wall integrity and stress response component 4-like n=1 Tax=Polistes dominula TaxID=743375 RepID=A0ABM1J3M4_POLDO|nr:PREDICTED: cell wall integrity and stress response component 4-like [Polistes dominula]
MRIFCVLLTLLVITVTSLARPQESEDANKTTTAVPLTPTIKNNDSPSGTPASMGKSNEKPNNVIAHTTPSVVTTTAVKLKEDVSKITSALTKTAVTPVTADSKADLSSSAIPTNDKTTSKTTIIATTVTTTAAPPTKSTTSSTTITTPAAAAAAAAAATSPTTDIVTTNSSNIVPTLGDITTAVPVTTTCPPSDRHFDGLSFLGGIILTLCLIGIGIFLCKYCQHVCEDKYRTL